MVMLCLFLIIRMDEDFGIGFFLMLFVRVGVGRVVVNVEVDIGMFFWIVVFFRNLYLLFFGK